MDKKYRIKRSQTGLGLFAAQDIETKEFIAEYTGKKIPTTHADTLDTKYLFEVDETWTIDGSTRGNVARYINHSCFPNAEADVIDGHILIHAIRTIETGEEITIDYGEEYFDEFIKPFGCKCEACFLSVSSAKNKAGMLHSGS